MLNAIVMSDGRYIKICKILPTGWDYDVVACVIRGRAIKPGEIFTEGLDKRRRFKCKTYRDGKAIIARLF
ncbi:hypothetical protein NECAME_01210 [Necator americanus]|uniref:Uncharacterized protein n=1 Tax=Necator americanus TaxID=51031 RepID=W2TYW4_NECAM|nr:hypothetical protein NECAME_01210 [Necator americanus]ETN87053.1 hypothetical protein NECAME_01210 [Necator americanus]